MILSRAVPPEVCDALCGDLTPYIEANRLHEGGFDSSTESRRFDGICARSRHADPIVAHPVLLQCCDAVLGQQALDYSPAQLRDFCSPDPRQPFQQLPWALHLVELIQVRSCYSLLTFRICSRFAHFLVVLRLARPRPSRRSSRRRASTMTAATAATACGSSSPSHTHTHTLHYLGVVRVHRGVRSDARHPR